MYLFSLVWLVVCFSVSLVSCSCQNKGVPLHFPCIGTPYCMVCVGLFLYGIVIRRTVVAACIIAVASIVSVMSILAIASVFSILAVAVCITVCFLCEVNTVDSYGHICEFLLCCQLVYITEAAFGVYSARQTHNVASATRAILNVSVTIPNGGVSTMI